MRLNRKVFYFAKMAAFALCFLLIATFLISCIYIFVHAEHEHDHNGVEGDCSACMQVANAERLLKKFSNIAFGALIMVGIFFLIRRTGNKLAYIFKYVFSLITLKVRLNN
ncbi:MAG: hypothetical protein LBQ68_07055 [Clostridiales bacterium]|jgi:hypothetical protein|nr:hypothetical protein [Clostridiales bacterium]